MAKNFLNYNSYIAWKNFEATGNLGFYMLYAHIENPPKELIYTEDMER